MNSSKSFSNRTLIDAFRENGLMPLTQEGQCSQPLLGSLLYPIRHIYIFRLNFRYSADYFLHGNVLPLF